MHFSIKTVTILSILIFHLSACSHDDDNRQERVRAWSHSAAYPEGATGESNTMALRITLENAANEDVIIHYQSVSGTATENEDYLPAKGQLQIDAGLIEASLDIRLLGDDELESSETITIELTSEDVDLQSDRLTGTIANDDTDCANATNDQNNPWLVDPDEDPLNYAHRGGVIDFPENTLYAYKQVAAAGADVLEMDVYQTADNALVIIHDLDVDRTSNGSGMIGEMTLAELKSLDAAYWFVQDKGTPHDAASEDYRFRGIATGDRSPPPGFTASDFQIPTLEEALQAFPNHRINVELKPDLDGEGDYANDIANLLLAYGRITDVIAASFVDEAAVAFKAAAPCIFTSVPLVQAIVLVLGSQGPETPMAATPEHVALQVPPNTDQIQQIPDGITVVTEELIADAHAANLAVQVWTINTCESMLSMIALGVDAIMTDRPLLLEQLLAQPRGQRSCAGLGD